MPAVAGVARRWRDAFRLLHGGRREFTWYSPNGNNGFRLDQAFVDPRWVPHVASVAHRWGGAGGGRRDALSDHAALLLELDPDPRPPAVR